MNSSFVKETYSIKNIEAGLRNIRDDIERCLGHIEKFGDSAENEIPFFLDISGLEIKMTNVASDIRRKFV